ncbi:potassium channel family protein [Pseudoalteromonas luteoviolacea]|uniref:potassium channel family protein n=1 Tax=Pseudoalteromonas luteoviolacea TaxID=43657 RepID=UPI001F3E92D2|nr:potassium channel family protein [Pseudoalteromonas luteoviolacea]MCF6441050.1 potassium channel family protein [Pseudoalteromonas luteoviolacea]
MRHFLKNFALLLLSPSRFTIRLLKEEEPNARAKTLKKWSLGLFAFEIFITIALTYYKVVPGCFTILLVVYGVSRCNEIVIAFYKDTLRILSLKTQNSTLTSIDRLNMAMRSYVGLIINFALIYFYVPIAGLFNEPFRDFFQAVYFSTVTLTTLGYGEIHPVNMLTEGLVIYQVLVGLMILLVAISTYLGSYRESK